MCRCKNCNKAVLSAVLNQAAELDSRHGETERAQQVYALAKVRTDGALAARLGYPQVGAALLAQALQREPTDLLEPGVFSVSINSTTETGATSIGVLAGIPEDRVRLMPEVEVVVGQSLADFDGNGVCNYFDVTAFIGAFLSQDPNADIVPTATWDFLDIAEFLLQYNSCNGG